jgi:hypothetical protein
LYGVSPTVVIARGSQAVVRASRSTVDDPVARRVGAALAFVVLPCFLVVTIAFLAPSRATYAWDFHPVWQAAGDVVHGTNPYTAAAGVDSQGTPYSAFIYPPLVADLLIPVAGLPYLAAALVFMIGSLLAIPLALWLLGVRDWRCYGTVFLWIPVIHGLDIGSLTPLLVLAVAAAWRFRDSVKTSSLAIASAVVTKVFLWPLVAWQAGRGARWSYKSSAFSLIALTVLPWATIGFAGFLSYPRLLDNEAGFWDRSYSLSALATAVGLPGGLTRLAVLALALAGCALTVIAQRRHRIDEREALALVILIAIACSPVSWLHYSSLLIVSVAVLSPRLSVAWLIPLACWITPHEGANGVIWRILVMLGVDVLTTAVLIVGHRAARDVSTKPRFGAALAR